MVWIKVWIRAGIDEILIVIFSETIRRNLNTMVTIILKVGC